MSRKELKEAQARSIKVMNQLRRTVAGQELTISDLKAFDKLYNFKAIGNSENPRRLMTTAANKVNLGNYTAFVVKGSIYLFPALEK